MQHQNQLKWIYFLLNWNRNSQSSMAKLVRSLVSHFSCCLGGPYFVKGTLYISTCSAKYLKLLLSF